MTLKPDHTIRARPSLTKPNLAEDSVSIDGVVYVRCSVCHGKGARPGFPHYSCHVCSGAGLEEAKP